MTTKIGSPTRTSESERVLADALAEALSVLGSVDYGDCAAVLSYLDRSPRAKRLLRAAHARLLLDLGLPQDEVGRMLSEDSALQRKSRKDARRRDFASSR